MIRIHWLQQAYSSIRVAALTLVIFLSIDSVAADLPTQPDVDSGRAINVVAIEYPPYSSSAATSRGLSFETLRHALSGSDFVIQDVFLPPARAAIYTQSDQGWLLSLFPPPAKSPHVQKIVYQRARIPYSLFRRHQTQPFRWENLNELAGGSVALTRTPNNNQSLVKYRAAGLTPVFINTLDQGIKMVLESHVDYVLTTQETGLYYAKKLDIDPQKLQFAETVIQWFPYTVYLNIRHPYAAEIATLLGQPLATPADQR